MRVQAVRVRVPSLVPQRSCATLLGTMSTRSRIGVEYPDGICKTIYCHFDGYPDGVGRVLLNSWSSLSKVENLLAHGDMSSIGDDLSSCTFYHRDRGEDLAEPRKAAVRADISHYREEFTYLWVVATNRWEVDDHGEGFMDLQVLLANLEADAEDQN